MTRTFRLVRDVESSGTVHVADGTEYDDGTVVIHWRGQAASTAVWPGGLTHAMQGHDNDGTRIAWDRDANAAAIIRWLEGLGQRVSARRRATGLSLRDAAGRAGIAPSTLLRVENGGDATLTSTTAILRWLDDEGDPRG